MIDIEYLEKVAAWGHAGNKNEYIWYDDLDPQKDLNLHPLEYQKMLDGITRLNKVVKAGPQGDTLTETVVTNGKAKDRNVLDSFLNSFSQTLTTDPKSGKAVMSPNEQLKAEFSKQLHDSKEKYSPESAKALLFGIENSLGSKASGDVNGMNAGYPNGVLDIGNRSNYGSGVLEPSAHWRNAILGFKVRKDALKAKDINNVSDEDIFLYDQLMSGVARSSTVTKEDENYRINPKLQLKGGTTYSKIIPPAAKNVPASTVNPKKYYTQENSALNTLGSKQKSKYDNLVAKAANPVSLGQIAFTNQQDNGSFIAADKGSLQRWLAHFASGVKLPSNSLQDTKFINRVSDLSGTTPERVRANITTGGKQNFVDPSEGAGYKAKVMYFNPSDIDNNKSIFLKAADPTERNRFIGNTNPENDHIKYIVARGEKPVQKLPAVLRNELSVLNPGLRSTFSTYPDMPTKSNFETHRMNHLELLARRLGSYNRRRGIRKI